MRCLAPLEGYRARARNESGKRSIVFDKNLGYADRRVTVPCGRCFFCRLERSRQWAMRCMHEASLHEENCFLTLTYDDEHLPLLGSLDRTAFPKFMKRLRKREDGKRIRYYQAGEYGPLRGRPHYHALLFGHDFSDKVFYRVRKGHPCYTSEQLEKLWPFGMSEISGVSFRSAAYVAKYVMKKRIGDVTDAQKDRYLAHENSTPDGEAILEREVEQATMSRRPGIGREWYDKFRDDTYPRDGVVMEGRLLKPPHYYDNLYELEGYSLREIKARRKAHINEDEERGCRALDRLKVAEGREKLNPRSLE